MIADFRAPDLLRFRFAPHYTRFIDVWDAVDRLAQVLRDGNSGAIPPHRARGPDLRMGSLPLAGYRTLLRRMTHRPFHLLPSIAVPESLR